ncbi:hypothetical protein D9619_010451 [Psilocybe cf. subviscida]|uniref:non-specific serine/threonine protein kinase n=1 Tax=Psilocybe cf. subviscida TaxID=2480587 RepID=A0A8H5ES87_9AGAR|nr:hypothetical protein D9619_010451 [Psilocybe cf. subviscida]
MSATTTTNTATAAFLDAYEPLDVIGNGSFGIIRKVRRKSDGLVFARKELNFERMSERDRKQIVAEVCVLLIHPTLPRLPSNYPSSTPPLPHHPHRNILKDLHHSHIVRYHDRFVDRDAGILYILMEYCGGGDLSTVIKQASRAGRTIPEDTIWHYFYQILHALFHCHHPNSHGRSASGGGGAGSPTELNAPVQGRRAQILHRDLKPDNVFLDENNTVKLGDFGLSKALAQASFANTYVGTPYYMSPELMQEKAYDSKSDIWSLGCLIYELCALKPPFHEAKTHSELSIFIRNGRIPPLPRGYSQALTSVIKSMLNLNVRGSGLLLVVWPAMRPSAAQLLQHERLELVSRVAEAEKMLSTVKSHRAIVAAKEREVLAREHSLQETQQHLVGVVQQKDREIAGLREVVAQLQQQQQAQGSSAGNASSSSSQQQTAYTRADVERAVKDAVNAREAELRALVMQREAEVAAAIARREEEIMEAVRAREVEVDSACRRREEAVREEVERVERWREEMEREVGRTREEVGRAWEDVEERRRDVEERERACEERETILDEREAATTVKGRNTKNPLEEVKNTFDPSTRAAPASHVTPLQARKAARPVVNGPVTSMPMPSLVKPDAQPTPRTNTNANTHASTTAAHATPSPKPSSLATPVARAIPAHIPGPSNAPFSAMKGVVLTATGETLATPSPAELVSLFERSPKVGLNFGRIFDFGAGSKPGGKLDSIKLDLEAAAAGVGDEGDSPPPSPSIRKERGGREGKERVAADDRDEETSSTSSGSTRASQAPAPQPNRRSTSRQQQRASQPPPTRIRCPSIRTTSATSGVPKAPHIKSRSASSVPQACSDPLGLCSAGSHSVTCSATTTSQQMKPLPHPHLRPSTSATNLRNASAAQASSSSSGVAFPTSVSVLPIPVPRTHPSPEYDFADEENLPSPFLKRVDKHAMAKAKAVAAAAASSSNNLNSALAGESTSSSSSSTKTKRRGSSGLLMRAVAAANSAGRRNGASTLSDGAGKQQEDGEHTSSGSSSNPVQDGARPTLASARKALLRP